MAVYRPGDRLRSQVSDVAVVVIAWAGDLGIACGGIDMVPLRGAAPSTGGESPATGNTLLGKRYISAEGAIEVLCTKGGPGELTCDGQPMELRHSKALPSSD